MTLVTPHANTRLFTHRQHKHREEKESLYDPIHLDAFDASEKHAGPSQQRNIMSATRPSMGRESLRQSLGRQSLGNQSLGRHSLGLATPGRLSDLNTPSRCRASWKPMTSSPWAYEFQTMWDRLNSDYDAGESWLRATVNRIGLG